MFRNVELIWATFKNFRDHGAGWREFSKDLESQKSIYIGLHQYYDIGYLGSLGVNLCVSLWIME